MSKARIIVGDNRVLLKTLQAKSIQTVITSPPYWGLRDYGTGTWVGGDENCDHQSARSRGDDINEGDKQGTSKGSRPNTQWQCKCGASRKDEQIGLESTPAEFVEQLCLVFDEVWRVLKDDGTLWLNLGDSYAAFRDSKSAPDSLREGEETRVATANNRNPEYLRKAGLKHKDLVGIPWRVAFALQERGWYLRQDIIWAKPNPMPESVTDRCTKSHEYLFLLTKSPKYYFDNEAIKEPSVEFAKSGFRKREKPIGESIVEAKKRGFGNNVGVSESKNKRDVWFVSTSRYKEAHFATYPPELITPCVLAGSKPDDWVLDPFSGSGTTGEVAMQFGRNYVGLELNPEYAALSEKRLLDASGLFGQVIVEAL